MILQDLNNFPFVMNCSKNIIILKYLSVLNNDHITHITYITCKFLSLHKIIWEG